MTDDLGPRPEPDTHGLDDDPCLAVWSYSAAQMRAYAAAERDRCADLCDRAADAAWIAWDAAADPIDQGRALEAEELAAEIRGQHDAA